MRHCYNRNTRDTENLDSITVAFVDVFSVLRRRAITPSIFTAESITMESEKRGKHGRPFLKISVEVLEKL